MSQLENERYGFTSVNPGIVGIELLPRLLIVRAEEGFLPTSRGELHEAFSVRTFRNSPGGAAKHIAEIAVHQSRYGADPEQATNSVTQEYFGYARRARTDAAQLATLQEEVDDCTDTPHFGTLNPNRIETAKGQFARFRDLTQLAEGQSFDGFPFPPLRDYTKNPKRSAFDDYSAPQPLPLAAERIAFVIGSTRLWEARRIVRAAIEDQRNRKIFWMEQLAAIAEHQTGQTRSVALSALKNLGANANA